MHGIAQWWLARRLPEKVWSILLIVLLPVIAALGVRLSAANHLLALQDRHHHILLAREQTHVLRRLAVDAEDAFRGYLLTQDETFLAPLDQAEARIPEITARIIRYSDAVPGIDKELRDASERLKGLVESKRLLLAQVKQGRLSEVLAYVKSGQGLQLSDAVLAEFLEIEDRFDAELERFNLDEAQLAKTTFWGLLALVIGSALLGGLGVRLFSRSITAPLVGLRGVLIRFGVTGGKETELLAARITSKDEIGDLWQAFQDMARRILRQIQELQAIVSIGHEINRIGPDGLDGVLRRITDSAAQLLRVDLCLILSRHEKMGCWVVEAASKDWHDQLSKSVLLWEELPVSVRAFETREPTIGESLREDVRPEVQRRNRFGESMLSVPLLSQGESFGVLVLMMERAVPREAWNVELSKAFADQAASAISNARLLERAQQEGKGLRLRLRQLEHLAETLAHDLKGPGERMEGLAGMLMTEYGGRLDERGARWLALIEENGKDLTGRVQAILDLARVGSGDDPVEAVDPASVIADVLKQHTGALASNRARVDVAPALPIVACHRSYVRQIFDNLISNAIKFTAQQERPMFRIGAERVRDRVCFFVSDNGPGVPEAQRERVFLPFTQLNPSGPKGSGIGLAIVRRIVELYDGRVWIEPGDGGGCVVKFTLPALGALCSDDPTAEPMGQANSRARSPSSREPGSASVTSNAAVTADERPRSMHDARRPA